MGCASGPVDPTTTIASDEPPPAVDPSPPPAAAPPDEAIAIAGLAATHAGTAVAGLPFVIVDRHGQRTEGVSGRDGTFAVDELDPPYDLRVGDRAFFGATRPDPYVEVEGEDDVAPPVSMTAGIHAPPCGKEDCVVDVVSASFEGHGAATATASVDADGEAVVVITWTHTFATRTASDIDVHVLVHDAGFTVAAYGRVRGSGDVGFVEAAAVATTEPLAIDARGQTSAELTLDVPGQDGVPGASFVVGPRLPRIEGATWRLKLTATAPPTSLELHRSSEAWSGTEEMGHDPPALPLPVGPEILRPLPGGALSARGAGLSWTPAPGTLFTVDVTDVARGAFRYRIVANESELPFRRIEALGLPRLRPGAHTLSLATAPFASVDDVVSPDDVTRSRRFDERRGGSATYETIPFTASP